MGVIHGNDINKELAMRVANSILEVLDGMPLEDSVSYLNGITMALVMFIRELKKNVTVSEEGGIERLVLMWLSKVDVMADGHFSKFIRPEVIELDLDNLFKKQ